MMPEPNPLLKRYQRLVEVTRNLAARLELKPLLEHIMEVAVDLAGGAQASVLLYDQSSRRLHFQTTTNAAELPNLQNLVVPEESIAGWVAINRKPQIINNVEQDERHYDDIDRVTKFQTNSMIAVPLVVQDKLVGVLEVLNKKEGQFNEEDQEILLALGAQAAVAIENARLFQQSDLVAEFVHELRTPLAQTIHQETQRLNELATVFLDLASLESGRAILHRDSVNLHKLLEECIQVAQIKAGEKEIEIHYEAVPDLPALVADRDKLKQVFLNLLNNAVKYNRPQGQVWVRVSLHTQTLEVAVQDSGVGIPPDQIANLFTKFFRASNVEGKTPGTGLGLSISRRIVEMHAGQLRVESVLNEGATFTVVLPVEHGSVEHGSLV